MGCAASQEGGATTAALRADSSDLQFEAARRTQCGGRDDAQPQCQTALAPDISLSLDGPAEEPSAAERKRRERRDRTPAADLRGWAVAEERERAGVAGGPQPPMRMSRSDMYRPSPGNSNTRTEQLVQRGWRSAGVAEAAVAPGLQPIMHADVLGQQQELARLQADVRRQQEEVRRQQAEDAAEAMRRRMLDVLLSPESLAAVRLWVDASSDARTQRRVRVPSQTATVAATMANAAAATAEEWASDGHEAVEPAQFAEDDGGATPCQDALDYTDVRSCMAVSRMLETTVQPS
jgi:hypothetical protein